MAKSEQEQSLQEENNTLVYFNYDGLTLLPAKGALSIFIVRETHLSPRKTAITAFHTKDLFILQAMHKT